jgi:hypothetical protein
MPQRLAVLLLLFLWRRHSGTIPLKEVMAADSSAAATMISAANKTSRQPPT